MKKQLQDAYLQSFALAEQHHAQFYACVGDLLATPQVQGLAAFEQHFTIHRLQHIMSVSYLSFRICKKLGLDYRTAARGGILHDLFYYDWREKDKSHKWHGYVHPGFALKNARELLGELDPLLENIILRHMWPLTLTPPKYKEAMIVSLADKYCAWQEIVLSYNKKQQSAFYQNVQALKARQTPAQIQTNKG